MTVTAGRLDEAMMRRAALAGSLQDFVARMWLETEKPWGADAGQFYTEKGVFAIEGFVHAEGPDQVRKVGSHREKIGPRVSRHIMSNYTVGDLDGDGRITAKAVMTHFGGTGEPPLRLEHALGIYDVSIIAVRQANGDWLLEQWRMRPAFLAKDHPAFGMPRELSHPGETA